VLINPVYGRDWLKHTGRGNRLPLYSNNQRRGFWKPEVALVQLQRSSEYAHELLDILVDRQAVDVVLLDLTELSSFADYFVIATVDNVRQARAIFDTLHEVIRARGHRVEAEGDAESGWILIDAGDGVYVHLFSLDARLYYNLEGLWHKAQEVVRVQ
jgi:ribosome-associated protein